MLPQARRRSLSFRFLDQLGVDGRLPHFLFLLGLEMTGIQMTAADPVQQWRPLVAEVEPVRAAVTETAHPGGSLSSEGGIPWDRGQASRLRPVWPVRSTPANPRYTGAGRRRRRLGGCPAPRSGPRTSPLSCRPGRPPLYLGCLGLASNPRESHRPTKS